MNSKPYRKIKSVSKSQKITFFQINIRICPWCHQNSHKHSSKTKRVLLDFVTLRLGSYQEFDDQISKKTKQDYSSLSIRLFKVLRKCR